MLARRLLPIGLGFLAALTNPLLAQRGVPMVEARRVAAFPESFSQIRGLRELSSGVVMVTDGLETLEKYQIP
jgi:hypothetical protein